MHEKGLCMSEPRPSAQQALSDLLERHVKAELDGDLETTMATMSEDPHLNHVASIDRKSTRLNSSHIPLSRMPSSA